MVNNHNGYGLRNDEKPFAYKIPVGGNWKQLSQEDKLIFWNGKIPTAGGSTNGLRRKSWDETAGTITTTPMQKLSCQIHPGYLEGEREMKEYDVTPQLPSNGLTVAELFCGGGLMAVGLKSAGYNITWANDFDPSRKSKKEQPQVTTYRHNIGDHVYQGDITLQETQALIPDVDIIAGGPPCQDFSVAGKNAGEDGEKGKLVYTYLSIIWSKQPKAFIFENVKGLAQKHKSTLESLIAQMEHIGYKVSYKIVNSWDYGVAQKRERVFIVGIREDLGFEYTFPEPEPHLYKTQVLWDVIGDLPIPNDGSLPKNHNEKDFYLPKREYGYSQSNRVQSMDGASNTIPAHHNAGQPIHPTQAPRRFTVRECLRIQSVPDWYVIPERVSLGAAYKIVGNGVASRVAYILGVALAKQLNKNAKKSELKRLIKEKRHLIPKNPTIEEWDEGEDESYWDEIYKEEGDTHDR